MPLSTFNFPSPALATQLPALPEGPSLENVRGPVEVNGGFETWQIALATLVFLLICGAFVWLYLRSRKQQAAPIDPHAAALAELDAASQAADDERFVLLCANAVRRFMQSTFNLPAISQTSGEIAEHLPLAPEEKNQIRRFLEDCDGVKFARQSFSETQRHEILDTARNLIETLKEKEGAAPA